jgi:SPP1 family predicted phage head-tail adaptor
MADKFKVGDLRDQVTILTKVLTPDGSGGQTQTWQSLGTVWAKIEDVSGSARFIPHKVEQEITHKVTIRYTDTMKYGIRSDDRLYIAEFSETQYEVVNVIIDRKKAWIKMEVREIKP